MEESQRLVEKEFAPLSIEALYERPAPKSWSIAECLEHLILANTKYLAELHEKFEQLEHLPVGKLQSKVRFSLTGRLFLYLVDPQYKIKVPAPGIIQPSPNPDPHILEKFINLQKEVLGLLLRAKTYPINDLKVKSPLSSLIRFRGGEIFVIIARHIVRHLEQAQRAKAVISKNEKSL